MSQCTTKTKQKYTYFFIEFKRQHHSLQLLLNLDMTAVGFLDRAEVVTIVVSCLELDKTNFVQ